MQLGGSSIRGRGQKAGGRSREPNAVGTEPAPLPLEESDGRAGRELTVAREDYARERNAGGLAAARKQLIAELDQAGRALLGHLAAIAGAVDQRAAALCDGLQHVAEKGGVHWIKSLAGPND